MKITKLTTRLVNVPLPKSIGTSIHKMTSVGCVLVFVETDQGIIGESYIFTINAARLKAFNEMVLGFAHTVVGKDIWHSAAIAQSIWDEINPTGHKGATISALSAIDTAVWDAVGKAAEKPLHHLFGACRDRVDAYASGGLWLSAPIDELQQEAQSFIEQGFRSMKIRLGSARLADDLARVAAVRDVVGPDIELLTDANQAFTPKQAIRAARALEAYDISWLEEPVAYWDLKGHADVRRAVDMRIASGESEYTRHGMRAMIEADSVDVLMPDLQRIGGLTEFRRVAALAQAYDLPISTHIFTEYSLCIAGSAPNCISVEHMPWVSNLFNEQMVIENGQVLIPDRPGTGFSFNHAEIKRLEM